MVTPTLPTLSVAVASLAPAGLRRLAAMHSCVANKPRVACASHGHGAAVPWPLYGLKIAETQSALNRLRSFDSPRSQVSRRVNGKKRR
jgi:hypothetical protein